MLAATSLRDWLHGHVQIWDKDQLIRKSARDADARSVATAGHRYLRTVARSQAIVAWAADAYDSGDVGHLRCPVADDAALHF